jgi:Vitamin B12 dependent methionine synthase, activation domain
VTAVSLTVPLRREGVLHFLGYRGRGVPRPRTEDALGPVLDEARALISPRGLFRIEASKCAVALGLKSRLGLELALGLVTIGFPLERRVTDLLASGETTRALLLDAAGSAAAEEAADELERCIHTRRVPRRFSPGYGAWPLTAQRALFELLPHEEIEVQLLPSCLMAPRKSVSFAVWLGPENEADIPEECRAGRCETCDMTTCPYREPAADREDRPRTDLGRDPRGREGT